MPWRSLLPCSGCRAILAHFGGSWTLVVSELIPATAEGKRGCARVRFEVNSGRCNGAFFPQKPGVGVFFVQVQRYQLVTLQIRGRKSGFSAVLVRFLANDKVRAVSLAALTIWAWAFGSDCPCVAWRIAEFWVAVLQFRLGFPFWDECGSGLDLRRCAFPRSQTCS